MKKQIEAVAFNQLSFDVSYGGQVTKAGRQCSNRSKFSEF